MTRRQAVALGLKAGLLLSLPSWVRAGEAAGAGLGEPQPYFAGVLRAIETLSTLGAPISARDAETLRELARKGDAASAETADALLARYTLARLSVGPGEEASLSPGGAERRLSEQGWRLFLVRVANFTGGVENIALNAGWRTPTNMGGGGFGTAQRATLLDTLNKGPLIKEMWLISELRDTSRLIRFGREVNVAVLSGIPVEYRVVQLYSRDSGARRAQLTLETFPDSAAGVGSSARREFDFECTPSRRVTLGVHDADGRGCMASLTIRDRLNRIYPLQAMRLAPDLFFQAQVYRADGETMRLPDGDYRIEATRGPEYLVTRQTVAIDAQRDHIDIRLVRWIDPAAWGWFSGDTHIHAGGCAHYQVPTEGVSPETMIRLVRGEGLSVGDVLTWAPSWYYQKQFFCGLAVSPDATLEHPELQAADNASLVPHPTAEDRESSLRYDVEVSGFPSSHAGHLVLLRLKDQDYPGTKEIEDWPSWNLPILRWAKAQGAVVGYAHCGSGMAVDSTSLPNYEIPPMDGIGTQEAIVDVTHGLVDFLSGCDTAPVAELNAWYHMLNCGFRLALVGETDFPCITADRVGAGRSYVNLESHPVGDTGYDSWINGLKEGRLYCGDGRSHFLKFTVNGQASGGGDVTLANPGPVQVEALVAARLEPAPTEAIRERGSRPWSWGWHLEQARIGSTRTVAVELVVNGMATDKAVIEADGAPRNVRWTTIVERSSWIALRVLPSSHTHPVFVNLGQKPIRASQRSARWCRASVDKIWEVKAPFMRESEHPQAAAAFDHARQAYERIASESDVP